MPNLTPLHDAINARRLTEEALAAGVDPIALINRHMVPAMDEVGRRYECSEFFVPELLLAARAMKAGLELLRPLLARSGVRRIACVVVGTVKGDLHDIGKNLVAAMFEGAGFEVIDLGVSQSNDFRPSRTSGRARQWIGPRAGSGPEPMGPQTTTSGNRTETAGRESGDQALDQLAVDVR